MKNDSRPLLSISLLTNGKKQDVTIKCFKSLITIKKHVPTEIVVVDTGCPDDFREIVEKYADIVIDFEWCDNFAKARNAGLKKCTGKWFMFVDDDEWFENTDAIVDFFQSGEYKKYKWAKYLIKNYTNVEGTDSDDFWSARLSEHVNDLHFEGLVHEYLTPLEGRYKLIDSFEHHYGYAFINKTDRYAKSMRNIRLLLKMKDEDSRGLLWRVQLIQEYEAVNNYEGLAELCQSAIDTFADVDNYNVNRYRSDFYSGKLLADNLLCQYEETLNDFELFRKDRRNNSVCIASLYYTVTYAYMKLKKYKYSEDYCRKYLDIYDEWKKCNDFDKRIEKESGLTTNLIFSERNFDIILSRLIAAKINGSNFKHIHEYINRVNWKNDKSGTLPKVCEAITNMFIKDDYRDEYVEYANDMLSSDASRNIAIYYARKTEKDEPEDFDKLIQVYGRTGDCDDCFILYMKLRYYDSIDDVTHLKETFYNLLNSLLDIFNLDNSVWNIAEKRNIDLLSILKEISFERFKESTSSFLSEHSVDNADRVEKLLRIMSVDNDIRFMYFRLKVTEMGLISRYINEKPIKKKHIRPGYEKEDRKTIEEAKKKQEEKENKEKSKYGDICVDLEHYCNGCVSFYHKIYSQEWFTGKMTVLPPQCRFAVRFLEAIEPDNNIKSSDRIKVLEKCVDIYTPFNRALGEYIKEYGEREKTKLLQIQKNPELEKVYQMLDLLKQAIELQEKTGSEELQAGIMQQRQLVESMLTSIIGDVSIDSEADNSCWILSVKELIENNGK